MIVCATRGGEASRAVQKQAFAYAKEHGAKLMFVFIVDETQYKLVDSTLAAAFHSELVWIGQTLMRLLKQRGTVEDVDTEFLILEGTVRDQLSAYLRETQPDKLYVGAPRGTTKNVFGDDEIEQFAFEIQQETNVDVIIARPEE